MKEYQSAFRDRLSRVRRRTGAPAQKSKLGMCSYFKRLFNSNTVVALFTAVMAATSIAQWWVINKQLSQSQADSRAWLQVTPRVIDDLNIHVNHSVPIALTLKNVGHEPAFNVRILSLAAVGGQERIEGKMLGTHELLKMRCNEFRRRPLDNPARGFVIFPGDDAPSDRPEVDGTIRPGFDPALASSLVSGIDIYGCVDYLSGNDFKHHQTGFIYTLAHVFLSPDGRQMLSSSFRFDEVVPKDSLLLMPSPSASINID